MINRRSSVKGEVESYHGRTAQIESRMQQLRSDLEAAQAMLHEAGQKLEEASQMVGGKAEEVRSLEESLSDRSRRRHEIEGALRLAEESYSASQTVLTSEKARLSVLEELSKALEGYEAGPKALLLESGKRRPLIPGKPGPTASGTKPRGPSWPSRLALGHRLQTLLCSSVDDGLKVPAMAANEWG